MRLPAHILTLPPERSWPQPQHVRKGMGLGTLQQDWIVGAAAAEASRAPALSGKPRAVVVSRYAGSGRFGTTSPVSRSISCHSAGDRPGAPRAGLNKARLNLV